MFYVVGVEMLAVWKLESELAWTEKQVLSALEGALAIDVRCWVVDVKDSR